MYHMKELCCQMIVTAIVPVRYDAVQMLQIKKIFSLLFPLSLGALAGFLYWYFIGCSSGTCPISAHWWTSTSYGLLVGAVYIIPGRKEHR